MSLLSLLYIYYQSVLSAAVWVLHPAVITWGCSQITKMYIDLSLADTQYPQLSCYLWLCLWTVNLLHIWTILEVHLGKPHKKITTESLINASPASYYFDNCPIFCGCFLKASLCWLLTSLWSTLGFIDRYFKSNSILFLSFVNLPLWTTLFLHLTFQLMWSLCCQKYSSKSKYSLFERDLFL